MDQSQTYKRSSFYVGWIIVMLVCDKFVSPYLSDSFYNSRTSIKLKSYLVYKRFKLYRHDMRYIKHLTLKSPRSASRMPTHCNLFILVENVKVSPSKYITNKILCTKISKKDVKFEPQARSIMGSIYISTR